MVVVDLCGGSVGLVVVGLGAGCWREARPGAGGVGGVSGCGEGDVAGEVSAGVGVSHVFP